MLRIRQRRAFKPYGAAISAIEVALWDVAGKAAGVSVYKLLGGKVRDRVRVYNGAYRKPLARHRPEDFADEMKRMMALPEGFTIVKQGISFHSPLKNEPDYFYGEVEKSSLHGWLDRGPMTERGMAYTLDCVAAMKEAVGDKVGLALDCGPGWMLPDAIRFARAVEKHNLMWLEDMLTGDYVPFVNADVYREVTPHTTTPIHTGEQIYLRQNFKTLIDGHAVDVIGPDPCDVGGIAELKWVAEYADLYGISIAPHGTANGIFGLASMIQVCATLPDNLIAFEYPARFEPFWYDITEGFDGMPVKNGLVDVYDRPGLGVNLIPAKAKKYLSEGDSDFFD